MTVRDEKDQFDHFVAGVGDALMQQTERLVSHYMASASSEE